MGAPSPPPAPLLLVLTGYPMRHLAHAVERESLELSLIGLFPTGVLFSFLEPFT